MEVVVRGEPRDPVRQPSAGVRGAQWTKMVCDHGGASLHGFWIMMVEWMPQTEHECYVTVDVNMLLQL